MDRNQAVNAIDDIRRWHYANDIMDEEGLSDLLTNLIRDKTLAFEIVYSGFFKYTKAKRYFHGLVEMLHEWAGQESPPDVRSYGPDAEKWLSEVKRTKSGIYFMIGGAAAAIASALFNVPGLIPIATAITGAGLTGTLFYEAKSKGLEHNPDVEKYISDIAKYYSYSEFFSHNGSYFIEPALKDYHMQISNLQKMLESVPGDNREVVEWLNQQKIEVQNFQNNYPEALAALKQAQSYPLPVDKYPVSIYVKRLVGQMGNGLNKQDLKEGNIVFNDMAYVLGLGIRLSV